jgi:alpha-1,6-mannosyltransferase
MLMLNANNLSNSKKNQILLGLAIILSLILCGELAVRAYSFYLEALDNSTGRYLPDFAKHSEQLRTGIEYLCLNIIYIVWLIINKNKKVDITFIKILRNSSFFLLISFIAYPITTDINLYIHYGLMYLNGINPFINPASTFTSELSPFLAWKQTSTYGPISQLFFMFSALFVAIIPSLGIYVFKLICLLFHILNSYLIWGHLKNSPHKINVTTAYLVSPLLLYEQVTNAHIDVLISTILIILIICLKNYNYLAAIVTAWIGFLIKTLPIVWLPLIFVYLIKQQRWKILFSAICISVAIIFATYLIALPSVDAWISLFNPGVKDRVGGSLYSFIKNVLSFKILNLPVTFQKTVFSVSKPIIFSIFVVSYLIILVKPYLKKTYSTTTFSINIGWITLILFLFAAPWYCSWYSSVLLAVVALNIDSNSKRFVITSIVFCFSSTVFYYLLRGIRLYDFLTVVPTLALIIFWLASDIQALKKSRQN